jgi:hypothetical protein
LSQTAAPPIPRKRVSAALFTAEGVGDAFVDGAGLAVDAVGVDREQDGDAVPGAAGDFGRRDSGVEP